MAKLTQVSKRVVVKVPTQGNDATNLGTNSVATANIQDLAVTNNKLTATAAYTVKGNNSANSVAPSDLTIPQIASLFPLPTVQKFTTGSGTYNKNYTFTIVSGNATVGATYTHNAITYTVYATVASSVQVIMSGSAAPLSSGTLTKASGTGDSTLTFVQVFQPLYLKIKMVGGGGGGAAGGNSTQSATNNGANGTQTTFGSNLTASFGSGGVFNGGSGSGGVATIGPGFTGFTITGGNGSSTIVNGTGTAYWTGGLGGANPFGASGSNSFGASNTGTGGSGGGISSGTSNYAGTGGGAGGYIEAFAPNPSATYTYVVGAGGSGGPTTSLTAGVAGYAGASGIIIVEEYYN